MTATTIKRLGSFTRLLDRAGAAERYRLATEQILEAERSGYDSAWIAQHHFHEDEGGLPSPFVFLAHVAAKTSRIRLGTGVVTLPMENAVRVAEDAVVLDLLSGGRLEFGVGSGGTPNSFLAFGETFAERGPAMGRNLATVRDAWAGQPLGSPDNVIYPSAGDLDERVWQATFSVEGGRRAGEAGDGLTAIAEFNRTKPDVVLMDITMPQMEGIEAVERIVRQHADARIVMVSSVGYQENILAALQKGAKHFVQKPVKPEVLYEVIKYVLGEDGAVANAAGAGV